MAPRPAAAKTRPRSRALPPISFFTTYGSSTSNGPSQTSRKSAAASSVPHSHTSERTKANPSRMSDRIPAGGPVRGAGRDRPHQREHRHRDDERSRVEQEDGADADGVHQQAAEGRPHELHGEGPYEPVDRVRLHEQVLGDEVRDGGTECGRKQGVACPVESREGVEVPELERARDREHAHRADRDGTDDVREDHHAAAVETVGDHAAEEQEDDHRGRPGEADEGERGRAVGQLVDLPGHGDDEDAVADERHGHPRPQKAEVADRERTQDAEAAFGSVHLACCLSSLIHRSSRVRRSPVTHGLLGIVSGKRLSASAAYASRGLAQSRPAGRSSSSRP